MCRVLDADESNDSPCESGMMRDVVFWALSFAALCVGWRIGTGLQRIAEALQALWHKR